MRHSIAALLLLLSLSASAQLRGPAPTLNASTPAKVELLARRASARYQEAVGAIASLPPGSSFDATFKAFDRAGAKWAETYYGLYFLQGNSPDEAVRKAAKAAVDRFQDENRDVMRREDLYRVMSSVSLEELDAIDRRNADELLDGFKGAGFGLTPEKFARLKEINKRLQDIQQEFSQRLTEDQETHALPAEALAGLPPGFAAELPRDEQGLARLPIKGGPVSTFMQYADSDEHRKAVRLKYENRGGVENLELWGEALALRKEFASIHGYKSYPEAVLEDRMAGSVERVLGFLNKVREAVAPALASDKARLLALKRETDPAASEVKTWEKAYLSRKLQERELKLNPEELRPYFPADRVVPGVLKLYERIYGLRFREVKGAPVWHPEVMLYEALDRKTGAVMGSFYLDLYERPGKRDGAAAYTVVPGRRQAGRYRRPVTVVAANFRPGTGGLPALLKHSDVVTLAHELGHTLHNVLTRARHAAQAGTAVKRDFVETPSQMPEYFMWERAILKSISRHVETGEPLPDEMIDRLLASKGFLRGLAVSAQAAMAVGDIRIHLEVPADVSGLFNRIMEEVGGFAMMPGGNFVAGFQHIMTGYSVGYYGYLWSDQIAAWTYELFKKAADGPLSRVVGERFRRTVLRNGGQIDPNELMEELGAGVPFSEEPFMRELLGDAPNM